MYTKSDFEKYKGKIITFEGSDGTGKETQTLLLRDYLKSLGLPVYTSGFPQYTRTSGGLLLARLLRKTDLWYGLIPNIPAFDLTPEMIEPIYEKLKREGLSKNIEHLMSQKNFKAKDFLSKLFDPYIEAPAPNDSIEFPIYIPPKDIPALIVSIPYAIDRAEFAQHLRGALKEGFIVLLDRYWTSNLGHQVGKVQILNSDGELDEIKTVYERKKFIQDLIDIELKGLHIPVESAVINLNVTSKNSTRLIENRNGVSDVLEIDPNYILASTNNYKWLSFQFKHWLPIDCQDDMGRLRNKGGIHQSILEKLVDFNLVEHVYQDYF